MADNLTRAEIQVLEARPNPDYTSHRDRWIVRCKVIQVLSGSLPKHLSKLTLLMHSPTKTFATDLDDLPQYRFTVELEQPISELYAGDLTVLSWRKAENGH